MSFAWNSQYGDAFLEVLRTSNDGTLSAMPSLQLLLLPGSPTSPSAFAGGQPILFTSCVCLGWS